MTKTTVFLAAVLLLGAATSCTTSSPRKVSDFNFDWKFALSDSEQYAKADFDDTAWRELHLPHDWAIEGDFSKDNPSTPSGGALPGGIGWYRKTFKTPELSEGGHAFVEFDGIFMNGTVYVNGSEVGSRPYGYTSVSYEITPFLKPAGEDNLIAVRCDNSDQPNSRWYAGCGIYRDVRLVCTGGNYVAYNGIQILQEPVSGTSAVIRARVDVHGEGIDAVKLCVRDSEGNEIAAADAVPAAGQPAGMVEGQAGEQPTEGQIYEAVITLEGVQRWDIDDPCLYSLEAEVVSGGRTEDCYSTRFGVREIRYDADKGFFLNGRNVKMKGVCMHHDMGCIGSAVHRRAIERQLQILREMGVNAIRTSHNPPAPQLLELCDEMGFLVIDEAFDMWRKRKTQFDYARFFDRWHEKDLRDFIRRDRNHPCIVMWSIGNEILEQWNSDEDDVKNLSAEQANLLMNFLSTLPKKDAGDDNPNIRLTRHLADIVHEEDPTRPVTAGCNETGADNNLLRSGALDLYGFNYHLWDYDKCRAQFPGVPLFGSETVSSLNSRGVYFQPSTKTLVVPEHWWEVYETPHHQCTAYDACHAPWASPHEESWTSIRDREWMFGTFIWTGFDYLGEPTPYSWPSRSSYFGVVDLAGFPKDAYYMYKAEWTDDTVLHLFPHWNWKEGDKIDVWCWYNNADEVELFVNGESLGRKSKTESVLHCIWPEVEFRPGSIEAVSYRDGKEVARESRITAGEVARLVLEADRPSIEADGYDLCFVSVKAVDEAGVEVPDACIPLEFSVSGKAEFFGSDNGNAADTVSLKSPSRNMFNGRALAVLRSIKGAKGTAALSVRSGNMEESITINTR